MLSEKGTSPWERDAKVVEELGRALDPGKFGAIVVHLLGLDDCKNRGLSTNGAMRAFRYSRSVSSATRVSRRRDDGPFRGCGGSIRELS